MADKIPTKRLNADVPSDLKRRVDIFCAKEEMHIYEFVVMALENALAELDKENPVIKGGDTAV